MNLWSWIFFPRSRVFERSGRRPSSAGQVPHGRLRAIWIFCVQRVREMYCSCALCFIRARFLFVRDLCAIRVIRARFIIRARYLLFVRDVLLFARDIYYSCVICAQFVSFVRDLYYSCTIFIHAWSVRDSCHDVFIGPGFDPLHFQHDHFVGPGFDSRVRSPVSGQWNPWPMSLHNSLQEANKQLNYQQRLLIGYAFKKFLENVNGHP